MAAVYMYSPAETETGKMFRHQLCSRIGKVTLVDSVGQDDVPLAVMVHNFSRIGTDIDGVMMDIPDDIDKRRVAIVVLHVTAPHALPSLPPTSTLSDEKYSDYGCMVDFFFTQNDGIYSCRLNDDATNQLKGFLKSYRKSDFSSFVARSRPGQHHREINEDNGRMQVSDLFKGPCTRDKKVFWTVVGLYLTFVVIVSIIIAATSKSGSPFDQTTPAAKVTTTPLPTTTTTTTTTTTSTAAKSTTITKPPTTPGTVSAATSNASTTPAAGG